MADEFPTLRKTASTVTVLRAMFNGGAAREYHGYELAKQLKSHQSAYAIFRKLEAHALVSSRWEEVDGRRRRYYRLTGSGIDYCRHLFADPRLAGGSASWSLS